jgi:hypothetical protein
MSDRHAWVKEALTQWAAWADARDKGALGYPSVNLLARSGGRSASTDHIPVGLQQAESVDAVVRQLRQHDGALWCVLMCAYLGDPRVRQHRRRVLGTADIGRVLHMHRDTVLRKLRQAEEWIGTALCTIRR